MRVFAVSDVHVDYPANASWVADLSSADFTRDVLILAGDVSDSLPRLGWCLETLAAKFATVLFVPGNHDLWVMRDEVQRTSLEKFDEVRRVAETSGALMKAFHRPNLVIVPLLGWYDYSFGLPGEDLLGGWMDFHACRWPNEMTPADVTAHFTRLNGEPRPRDRTKVITFSHFMPRIDLIPSSLPPARRWLYPVLGATVLDQQLRQAGASIHVYGHSHLSRRVTREGVTYVNNAFGYPHEAGISSKRLLCIDET